MKKIKEEVLYFGQPIKLIRVATILGVVKDFRSK